jgi:ATP-dependent phosphofructokinase / diphosphate-dependent phosphofructokinase
VLEARKFSNIGAVYGAYHGVRGIVDQNFADLTKESAENLERVAQTPSSALGSTRDKPDAKYCQEIFKSVRAHGITGFFYIGGNDSADTVRIVSQAAREANYPLRCIHIPKTIDNDLTINDHTPGFPSAARFVVQAFMGANLDNISLPGVYIGVVMGRHAGFLTAASALARSDEGDGPHLVYVPEQVFDTDAFLGDVKRVMEKHGRCVVAVSEGIADAKHQPIATTLAKTVEKDAHGNVQLGGGALADMLGDTIKDRLGYSRVRGDTFGYVQRSFIGCVSDVDQREARAAGEQGVQYAMREKRDGTVTIHRNSSVDYAVRYELSALEDVAGKTRTMGSEFLAGADVTDAFRQYLKPLLGKDVPQAYRLARNPVPKIAG